MVMAVTVTATNQKQRQRPIVDASLGAENACWHDALLVRGLGEDGADAAACAVDPGTRRGRRPARGCAFPRRGGRAPASLEEIVILLPLSLCLTLASFPGSKSGQKLYKQKTSFSIAKEQQTHIWQIYIIDRKESASILNQAVYPGMEIIQNGHSERELFRCGSWLRPGPTG